MPDSLRTRLAVALVAIAGLVLAGCSGPANAEGAAGRADELRLGYFANLTHAVPLIAVADGTFARELGGTQLRTQVFNAGPAAVEALFAGAIDAAYLGPTPAINAYVRSGGEAVRIVAGAASGGAALVVQPGISSAADLRAATLASPQLGGTQDVALRHWLLEQGLRAPVQGRGDVIVAPQENAQTLELFRSGRVQGAWLPEPWASRLVVEAGARVLVDEADTWPGGRFVTTHLVVSSTFLARHPDSVRDLIAGELATVRAVRADPAGAKEAANAALAALTGKPLAQPVLDRAWANLTITADPIASSLQATAEHAKAVGTLRHPQIDGIYDLRLLNGLLAEAGEPTVGAAGLGQE